MSSLRRCLPCLPRIQLIKGMSAVALLGPCMRCAPYDVACMPCPTGPTAGINTTVLDNDIYVLWYAGSVLNVASYFSNSTKGTYFGDNVGLKVNEETVYWPPGTMPDVAEVRRIASYQARGFGARAIQHSAPICHSAAAG